MAPAPLLAHEGHEHSPTAIDLPTTLRPRAVATGDEFEAVAVLIGDELRLSIDRYADNVPVTAATVTITIGKNELRARPTPDGTYVAAAPEVVAEGRHDLVIAIQDGPVSDLIVATLNTPPLAHSTIAAPAAGGSDMKLTASVVPVIGTIGVVALLAALLRRRSGSVAAGSQATVRKVARLGILLMAADLVIGPTSQTAQAHGDEDHGAQPNIDRAPPSADRSAISGDAPRRLADGSVFLPKVSQRLLDVRTVLTKQAAQTPRQSFVGRIIANPNRSGVVQSNSGGRIAAPTGGLPRLGQTVKAGDVLATVTPGSLAVGGANLVQIAGDIDQQIMLARTKLERAQRLFSTGAGTRVLVDDTETTLRGLERRRADINTGDVTSETLIAPVGGVISASRAVLGQVLASQDIVFEIVDPTSLWVEAFVFDAAGAAAFKDPIASSADGRTFPLTFLGRSRSLRQQSAILQFEITTLAVGLDVGSPVTVHALSGNPISGVVLPRSAVVRAANGEDIVWRHTEPERFVAQAVRVSAFDGAQVLVQAGLATGERIVVQGAELINQVR